MTLHCCEMMDRAIDPKCDQHPNPADCSDTLITYSAADDSYGIRAPVGENWVTIIQFCPWCGDAKRDLRDARFDLLEALGYDDPSTECPDAFKTDQWWRERGL